jgi:hypothetical protein
MTTETPLSSSSKPDTSGTNTYFPNSIKPIEPPHTQFVQVVLYHVYPVIYLRDKTRLRKEWIWWNCVDTKKVNIAKYQMDHMKRIRD